MKTSLDKKITAQLRQYITGDISLQNFHRWFTSETWNVEQHRNTSAAELTYEIELRLAEYANGDWTEQELKDLLRPLVSLLFDSAKVTTSSMVQITTKRPESLSKR